MTNEEKLRESNIADKKESPKAKINALPPVTPKPMECEDAVSREAVLEITAETGALETQARVKALPPVTPKPKTGKWIPTQHFDEWYCLTGECSYCGFEHILGLPYCPCCGAKMETESEEGESE